uniref:NB-ARC domain-containing protein n=1 Tax=Leersia perrieri TaxID=77586 RepID=A0A0D9X5Z4_9ORYZ
MAETAILLAIKKISIVVAGEILSLSKPMFSNKKSELAVELPTNMELVKDELEIINAFLKKVNTQGCSDKVLETWMVQVRRLAYDIEDIVDQFIYVVGEQQSSGFWSNLKKAVKKPQSLTSLDRIATEVDKVKLKLKELSSRRDRWIQSTVCGLNAEIPNYDDKQGACQLGHNQADYDDDELVGVDEYREILTKSLYSEHCSLRIIAICGMGGLGKSCLVYNVFKRVQSHCDCSLWISVSQSYKMDDILRNMFNQLRGNGSRGNFDISRMRIEVLKEELKMFLEDKRYIIALDDVWRAAVLLEIRDILLNTGKGSRLIITTRIDEVAAIAEDDCKIKLEPLSQHDAWTLFCKKVFWKTENHDCPPELQKWGLPIETISNSIGELFNLKYLCLNDTNLKSLPKTITKLRNLETLSLERTQANKKFVSRLGNLAQLRSLYISDVKSNYCPELCSSLAKMQHLLRLHVKASNQDEVLRMESLKLPPELQTLQLTGKLAGGVLKSPSLFSANGNSLVRLSLCWSDLTESPIPYLSKLSNLTSLHLQRTYNGHQLRFHAGLFPKLKGMTLKDMVEVRQIYMEEGTMISLEYLKLDGLKHLANVPDGI